MKKTLIIVLLIMLSTIVFSCSVSSIQLNTPETEFLINKPITFTVNTTGTCKTTDLLNVYVTDLITLKKETIYSGKVKSNKMKFKYTPKTEGIKKIYAQTTTQIKTTNPKTKKITTSTKTLSTISIPITIRVVKSGRVYTTLNDYGIYQPEDKEYGLIDINLLAYNHTSSTTPRTSNFGFFFLNNDFNIISQTITYIPKLGSPYEIEGCTKEVSSNYYKYLCKWNKTFQKDDTVRIIMKLSKFKYNDLMYTFGTDYNFNITLTEDINYDQKKDINSIPFATITNTTTDLENKTLTIDYNIYNYSDVNYCALMIDGNEAQRNYSITENNQFIQDLNLGTYTIDITCFTDTNHYIYGIKRGTSDYTNISVPWPELDNVPFSLDSNFTINFSVFSDGNGSIENPYQVSNCDQLDYVRDYPESNFVLASDVDCTDVAFSPIESFSGDFNGNGKVVTNLTIDLPLEDSIGLFKTLSGNIHNLGLDNVNIAGDEKVGGITGINNGLIEEVFVTGTIVGNNYVGGIAGINERVEVSDGFPYNGASNDNDVLREINNSYTMVDLIGGTVGGITGYNKGKIDKVYSLGTINGSATGGLTGINYTACYSYTHAMKSGIINDSFSTIDTTSSNSCYSHWYYGSAATENGEIENTIVGDENYLGDIENPPFNSWDFDNTWKLTSASRAKYLSTPYPVLAWENIEEPEALSLPRTSPTTITLTSPIKESDFYGTKVKFTYELNGTPESCSLIVDNKIVDTDDSTPFGTITETLEKGEHSWKISCIDKENNVIESENQTVYVYDTETLYYCRQYDDGLGWKDYTKYTLASNINSTSTILASGSGSGSGTISSGSGKIISSGSGASSGSGIISSGSGTGSGTTTTKSNSVPTNCFTFNPNNSNIVVDCLDQTIKGSGSYSGAIIYGSNNIKIMNCEFSNFSNGITNINGTNITLDQVSVLSNYNYGVSTSSEMKIKDSIVCNNSSYDLVCTGDGYFNNLGNLTTTKIGCDFLLPENYC